jgi:hypothetical protein
MREIERDRKRSRKIEREGICALIQIHSCNLFQSEIIFRRFEISIKIENDIIGTNTEQNHLKQTND